MSPSNLVSLAKYPPADAPSLRIYYRHCGEDWEDTWSSAVDSECPVCGKDIEAYEWEEIDDA